MPCSHGAHGRLFDVFAVKAEIPESAESKRVFRQPQSVIATFTEFAVELSGQRV